MQQNMRVTTNYLLAWLQLMLYRLLELTPECWSNSNLPQTAPERNACNQPVLSK